MNIANDGSRPMHDGARAHAFNPTILREYDVRGIVGETLSPANARALGRAFAAVVDDAGGKRVAVGRDGRVSSPELEGALIEGLLAGGIDVLRVGLGPTPMLYFAVNTQGVDGGIMVTGSHNPANYNGFKLMLGKKPFFGSDIQRLGRIAAAPPAAAPRRMGTVEERVILEAYVARLLTDYDGTRA